MGDVKNEKAKRIDYMLCMSLFSDLSFWFDDNDSLLAENQIPSLVPLKQSELRFLWAVNLKYMTRLYLLSRS